MSASGLTVLLLLFALAAGQETELPVPKTTTTAATGTSDEDVLAEPTLPRQKEEPTVTAVLKESEQKSRRNATFVKETSESGFTPSFHLEPIVSFPATVIELPAGKRQESKAPATSNPQPTRVSAGSPFNNVRTMKFENGQSSKLDQPLYRPSDKIENFVKFVEQTMKQYQENFGSNQRYGAPVVEPQQPDYPEHHQHLHRPVHGVPDESYGSGQPHLVTYWTTPPTAHGHDHHHPPAIASPESQQPASHQHESHYAPVAAGQVESQFPHYHQPEPPESHGPHYAHFHHHAPEAHHEPAAEAKPPGKPDTVINVHPISYQATTLDGMGHPKTVIYVTSHEPSAKGQNEHAQHWQYEPHLEHHHHLEHHFMPIYAQHHLQHYEEKSVSPWKKILHVIGTFLPLGLLIALLSPRVISGNNNGEPNIILSKLRVNDLRPEHKHNRLAHALDTGQDDRCEERSVCRLLEAADARLGSDFLRHLLIHAAERTSESAVRKKELDRIFEAAKLGKCEILTCNFYDGT